MNQNKKRVNPKGKPRKIQNKRRGKEVEVNVPDESVNKADVKGFDNDYTWYTKYPQLFDNVSGANYGVQVGSQLNWYPGALTPDSLFFNATAAGICAIHYIPTLGAANQNIASPLNKVGAQLYATMRRELGSTAQYDATDITLYLGAMDSAYLLYELGVKIYGMLQMASPFNNYFLENLLKANCVDFESFSKNMSNFRSVLNQYAIFLSSRLVPADFDIFRRHAFLLQNMFTDSNTAKAQIYTYVPDGYYSYVEATEGPGYLKFTPFAYAGNPTTTLTFQQWSSAINGMYESLIGSTDIDQMSADIGKAFSDSLFTLQLVNEDYITPIGYSKEALSQIENSILCGYAQNTAIGETGYNYFDIYQTIDLPRSPRLIQNTSFYMGGGITSAAMVNVQKWCVSRKLVNFHWMNPSKEDLIVATRNVPGALSQIGTTTRIQATNYGTELCTYADFIYLDGAGDLKDIYCGSIVTSATPQVLLEVASLWSQFDWAPKLWLSSATNVAELVMLCDLDMYAMLDELQLSALNMNAVLSEFYSNKFPTVLN